jgi:hypothetical protein
LLPVHSLFASAQLHPAKIFSDSMVLQRGTRIPCLGPRRGRRKNCCDGFNQQTKTTVAAADGKWRVDLDALKKKAALFN